MEIEPEIKTKGRRPGSRVRLLWGATALVLLIAGATIWYQRRSGAIVASAQAAVPRATRVLFSPERGTKYLAAAFSDGRVRLWDTATKGEVPVKLPSQWTLNDLAWARDGGTLFVGGFEQHVLAVLVKSARAAKLPKFDAAIVSLAARPGKPELLVSLANGELWWLNLQTAERLAVVSGHTGIIKVVRYQPDGLAFVTGGADQQLVWHAAETRVVSKTVAAHQHEISGLAFSTDGTRVATGSWDNTVKVWLPAAETPLATLTHPEGVASVDWRGLDIVSSCWDGQLRVWNANTASIIHERACRSDSLAFAVWPGKDVIAEVDTAGTLHLNAP